MSIYSHCGCGSPRPLPVQKNSYAWNMSIRSSVCVTSTHKLLRCCPRLVPVTCLYSLGPVPVLPLVPTTGQRARKIYEEGVGREVVKDFVDHVSCPYACPGQQVQGRGRSEVASAEAARVAIVFSLCRALGHAEPCRAPWRLVYSLCTHAVFRYVGKEPLSRSRGFLRSLLCPNSYLGRGILNF